MIVVAIIALLATIALPGMLRTRATVNETDAIRTLRSVCAAVEAYRTSQPSPIYPVNLTALVNANPAYLTGISAGGIKSGYLFTVAQGADPVYFYSAIASPVEPAVSGNRLFCVDQTGLTYAGPIGTAFAAGTACAGVAGAQQLN